MQRGKGRKTNARGAFLNGLWYCDCSPRLPASSFQTKNGRQNHGRWFYTCQKKKCDFFLWADTAKVREESAVLNNSRSEVDFQTPKKSAIAAQQITSPTPKRQSKIDDLVISAAAKRSEKTVSSEDSFEWPSSGDDDLAEVAANVSTPVLETPRKAARTKEMVSPGKRTYQDMEKDLVSVLPILATGDDVFGTPSLSNRNTGLLSPRDTPAHGRPQTVDFGTGSHSSLASDALKILAPVDLKPDMEQQLVDLLNRHDLRTQGIVKGREISRVAIQAKDKKIMELQTRIAGLEAERETSRTVISHLKSDMAASPVRKGRGR